MFCQNCGHNMAGAEGAFCPNCGAKKSGEQTSAPTAQAGSAATTGASAKKPAGKKLLFAVAGISIVVIAAVLVFMSSPAPNVGDIMAFGGIEWWVLDVQDGRALLLSEKVLFEKAYDDTADSSLTWETSSLRHYLNNEFYNTFRARERSRIMETRNINRNNQWFGTNGGSGTSDRIFLLSLEEVVRYFGDSGQLENSPDEWSISDEYNSERIARDANGDASWWWLRSPGRSGIRAASVGIGGGVGVGGTGVTHGNGGVRPALWINL